MEAKIYEGISSKYILKEIFSCLKITKTLNIIKINKKLRSLYDITLFHYQYCYFFNLFKNVKIETFDDILDKHYLNIFPEDVRYELVWKLIEKRKLFDNDYIKLNIDDKEKISFIQKFMEKRKNKNLKYFIEGIEDKQYKWYNCLSDSDYYDKILEMVKSNENIIDKILYGYYFFGYGGFKKSIINIDFNNIKYLNINNSNNFGEIYDISFLNNLEYLSLSIRFSNNYINNNELKIKISENQYKSIKTFKYHESMKYSVTLKYFNFITDKNTKDKIFENLEELHIKENLLNQIHFNAITLKKLNIAYDYRDKLYTPKYIEESINNIIQKYESLTHLDIIFIYYSSISNFFGEIIEETTPYLFNLEHNLINFSFCFFDLNIYIPTDINRKLKFQKSKNKKSKFYVKGINIDNNMFDSYYSKIEEIDLTFINMKSNTSLYLEENNSISSISKLKIKSDGYNYGDFLYIPIKSFSSLNSLYLEIDSINFKKDFPLFVDESDIKFNNLEYLEIQFDSNINLITYLIHNLINIPNLKYLSIISKNICNTVFPYHKEIINKCSFLKKLHTLIIDHESNSLSVKNISPNDYSIYPELKNTNIKFLSLSKFFKNK